MSPSSRRAWIEIFTAPRLIAMWIVALLAEGVDRNFYRTTLDRYVDRRPPRGGRG